MISALDLRHLERTVELAQAGRILAPPNPLVGGIVVANGEVLGEGYHRRAGSAHAETAALAAVPVERRSLIRGATLYVNLEPCSHAGKTPACTEAIKAAGIARVVCCHRDPNPIAGGGQRLLSEAGISVDFLDPSHAAQKKILERSVAMNARFLWPLLSATPLVTLKWAMSLDGKIATSTGESQWISSPAGRAWALELRELHDAILIGSGTVLADDPRLNRRAGDSGGVERDRTEIDSAGQEGASGEIVRVVMDRRLRWQPPASMFECAGEILVFTTEATVREQEDGHLRLQALEDAGAIVIALEEVTAHAVTDELGRRGIRSLLVEGGAGILGVFAQERLCHRVGVCCAPTLIGGVSAPGPVGARGVKALSEAITIDGWSVRSIGSDLVIEGMEKMCLQDLLSSVAE